MLPNPNEISASLRDAKAVNKLAEQLRTVPPSEAVLFLNALLKSRDRHAKRAGFSLVGRAKLPVAFISNILKKGLNDTDVSDAQLWCEAFLPLLGERKFVDILLAPETEVQSVVVSWYQLRIALIQRLGPPCAQPMLDALREKVEKGFLSLPESEKIYWRKLITNQ